MRRVPVVVLLLLGVAICVGLDFGYDAAIATDLATSDPIGWKFWLSILVITSINVLGATSLNVVNGMAGQFSIGHAGFVGLGAYLGGAVAAYMALWLKIPLADISGNLSLTQSLMIVPPVLLVVAIVSAGVGFVVGLPSLRLKGDYLAIVTLGFAEILRLTILGTNADEARNPVTRAIGSLGGALGYRGPQVGNDYIGVPTVAGPFWTVGVAALALFLAFRLKRSGFGRALRAVREDEIAASAVGVDPARYKVTAFVIAAVGAGIAGALLAIRRDGSGIVGPANMKFDKSFEVITMVILGGSGSVSGAAIGAVLYTIVFYLSEEGLQYLARNDVSFFAHVDAAALRMALFAGALIVVMLLRPEGILGERELSDLWKKKKMPPRAKKGPPPSSPMPSASQGKEPDAQGALEA